MPRSPLFRGGSWWPTVSGGEEQTVGDPSRVRVSGPLACYADGFRRSWPGGATRVVLPPCSCRWWAIWAGGLPAGAWMARVDGCDGGRLPGGAPQHGVRQPLVASGVGAAAGVPATTRRRARAGGSGPEAGPVGALLGRYARWLATERGLPRRRSSGTWGCPAVRRGLRQADQVALEHLCAGTSPRSCRPLPRRWWWDATADGDRAAVAAAVLARRGLIDQPVVAAVPPVA